MSSYPGSGTAYPAGMPTYGRSVLSTKVAGSVYSFVLVIISFLLVMAPSFAYLAFPGDFYDRSGISKTLTYPSGILPVVRIVIFTMTLPCYSSGYNDSYGPGRVRALLLHTMRDDITD